MSYLHFNVTGTIGTVVACPLHYFSTGSLSVVVEPISTASSMLICQRCEHQLHQSVQQLGHKFCATCGLYDGKY